MKAFLGSYALVLLAVFIGWVANIVQIAHAASGPFTVLLVIKCVGVFALPLGTIMGYVGMFS